MRVDIAIVGAGFAGLSLAHALSSKEYSVCLIDRRKSYPDLFRAEKIEEDQADIMRELDILQYRKPKSGPIGKLSIAEDGIVTDCSVDEQYGISYSETVNNLFDHLSDKIHFINKTVADIKHSDRYQSVRFSDESDLTAKLVVLATGGSDKLMQSLGIKRRLDSKLKSLNVGFDIAREDQTDFSFNGFNYFISDQSSKINYITIFPIGSRMRVNLFTQLDRKDPLALALLKNTLDTVNTCFPDLVNQIGDYKITSNVQVMPTEYYRLKNHIRPGFIIIGDEYQSVNPATGTGLSKVLTDVKLLSAHYIPAWFAAEDMGKKNMMAYYKDKGKISIDSNSMSSWMYYYNQLHPQKLPIHERIMHKLEHRGWY